MQYLLLTIAIVFETVATLCLKVDATGGRTTYYGGVAIGYLIAFASLIGALRQGMPLGIAYGIWAAAGVALAAVASKYLFKEPLTRRMIGGIAVIIAGVLLIELGAAH